MAVAKRDGGQRNSFNCTGMGFRKGQLVSFRLGAIHSGDNLRWDDESQELVEKALKGDKDALLPSRTEPSIQCQLEPNGQQIFSSFVFKLGQHLLQI